MKRRLAYTFGNHMHWVDMQWLWGDDVLPGSIRDMAALTERHGVKGGVNFDAVGYEKLAADRPDSLAQLREMVQGGRIEVIGGTFGQPYGLFQTGESNCRHLIFGVRACKTHLGVAPRTFWEEEFYFFPQLPQMLAQAGFSGASLFFQWTWHTPEVPREDSPVIWWKGVDGTQLLTATRNRLNLHQWPEDMDLLLDELFANPDNDDHAPALIQQWLELMPSRDWMCRAEVIGPGIGKLLADERFEIGPTTLGEYLDHWRPFAEEIPIRSYEMGDVWHGMTLGTSGDRFQVQLNRIADDLVRLESDFAGASLAGRPYATWDVYPDWELRECWRLLLAAQHHDCVECAGLCSRVAIGMLEQVDSQMKSLALRLRALVGASPIEESPADWEYCFSISSEQLLSQVLEPYGVSAQMIVGEADEVVSIQDRFDVVQSKNGNAIAINLEQLPIRPMWTPQPGYKGSCRIRIQCSVLDLRVHLPYSSATGRVTMSGVRKYPEGDWMTSPQYFEDVKGAFFSSGGIDIQVSEKNWLYIDSPVITGFVTDTGIELVVLTNDPWQNDFPVGDQQEFSHRWFRFRVGDWESNARRQSQLKGTSFLPSRNFAKPFELTAQGTIAEAFYREHEDHGRHTENYAGSGMHMPFILRLVDYNGESEHVQIKFKSEIAKAYKTNLLGQRIEELTIEDQNTIELPVRPFEIVTLYLDLVDGRKQFRDLDAKRHIWASVHRIEGHP